MKKLLLLATVGLLFSNLSFSQNSYALDKYHARLSFSVLHMGISFVDGNFKDFDAKLFSAKEDFSDAKIELTADVIGEGAEFLKDGAECEILYYDENRILGVEIPIFAELRVTESSMALRGDTATNVNKMVTLETGARITVPGFINEGDMLRIDTRSGTYMERVK